MVGITLFVPPKNRLHDVRMKRTKTKRKSLVVAHGRYDQSGFDTKVYQITRTGVSEWAWTGWNNSQPPGNLSLAEVRGRCWGDANVKAQLYQAYFAGVQRRPRLGPLQRLLRQQGFGAIAGDFHLLEQALFAFGNAGAAAAWLTQPAVELRGALPARYVRASAGWFRVFHELVRKEYQHRLPQE